MQKDGDQYSSSRPGAENTWRDDRAARGQKLVDASGNQERTAHHDEGDSRFVRPSILRLSAVVEPDEKAGYACNEEEEPNKVEVLCDFPC